MDPRFVQSVFGDVLDLGLCRAGRNLNLTMVRGFARLDTLALISAPDVFDQVTNKEGTQRNLDRKHARECLEFALGADAVEPNLEPRCFPEILLNARELDCVEVLDPDNPDLPLNIKSLASHESLPKVVRLRIHLSKLAFPKPSSGPQISRVDGNHRLAGTDEQLLSCFNGKNEHEPDTYPEIAFALLLGLSANQEARLFRDINHEHKGMETAHLDTLTLRITPIDDIIGNPELLPLYIAKQLTERDRAFEGKVFFGGSKEGAKIAEGTTPPLKINTLKTAIERQLSGANQVTANLSTDPVRLINLLDNFWRATKETYPEAWRDKKDHILLQTIGLHGFAMFGSTIIEIAYNDERVGFEDFMKYLKPVASFDLKRSSYIGLAGAGGAKQIQTLLSQKWSAEKARAEFVKGKL
jgi:DGQHR domain-containing protein